jgi:hypothetical protein
LFLPIFICFIPVLILAVIIGHLAILFDIGSESDPLGYTIVIKK